jgi:type II secretory ATPase GspE/PulE/Tfp pilus assembly ATPase PilB-like protein
MISKADDKILAEELVGRGLVCANVIENSLQHLQTTNESLRTYLVHQGYITEDQILDVLAARLNITRVNLKQVSIDKSVLQKVPVRFAWFYKFMPIKMEDKSLTLATAFPLDVKFQDEIRAHLGLEPHIMLAKDADIQEALNRHYGMAADMIARLSKESTGRSWTQADNQPWIEEIEQQESEEASIARLVNQILFEAYRKRATDIHIEPYRDKVRVRYRIDGVLVDANMPPAVKPFLPAIISRIKVMANLSIVEKRLPQDGSAVVKTKDQNLDLRISTVPTLRGESMVIRILPTNVMLFSLEKLGIDEQNLLRIRELLIKPNGIVLVTGPTGSGKTTTLYACLKELNDGNRKIITLEDPVEYEMEGITQIQVNPKVHLDFATGLRSVLRHDPDVIMVGEIRDVETAETAIRTALTGHMVFTTLHTNDAASGITRLLDMGLEPFLVASSLEAFVAQRLVRMICPKCKEVQSNYSVTEVEQIAKSLGMPSQGITIYHGKGCDHCNQTGYYGRTAIYEILLMNEEIRAAVLKKEQATTIKQIARMHGMVTLRQDGWRKVLNGMTTPDEVLYMTQKDAALPIVQQPSVIPPVVQLESATALPVVTRRSLDAALLSVKNKYDSRIYPRLKASIAVRYMVVEGEDTGMSPLLKRKAEHVTITKDISAGGLRFVSGYALPEGAILDLKIQLVPSDAAIRCLARVCRVEDDPISSVFNLVVYYLDISSADRAKIAHFVRKELTKKVPGPNTRSEGS